MKNVLSSLEMTLKDGHTFVIWERLKFKRKQKSHALGVRVYNLALVIIFYCAIIAEEDTTKIVMRYDFCQSLSALVIFIEIYFGSLHYQVSLQMEKPIGCAWDAWKKDKLKRETNLPIQNQLIYLIKSITITAVLPTWFAKNEIFLMT